MDENVNALTEVQALPIGPEQIRELTLILQKYKSGKKSTESRIVAAENWWKMRNGMEESKDTNIGADGAFTAKSGWLHNVIVNKRADALEAYPEPNILAREPDDKSEATILKSIVPVILEQNKFKVTYGDAMWSLMKYGTCVFKCTWNSEKNGIGDIDITECSVLNLFWEPGITDIQRSRYFFSTELVDKEVLQEMYPQLENKLKGNSFVTTQFLYDDTVDTANKATVIECYYHRNGLLHYCKFVEDEVLFATENDPQLSKTGLYDHKKYPFRFIKLFPIEGSPCGYGYVDICKNPQTEIDLMKSSFVKNAMVGATPRYFERVDGAINEEEFLDLTNPIVHVNGNLGEDSIRPMDYNPLPGTYLSVLQETITELRETSGNTETATGSGSPSGVTAASAIAALQEAAGKSSKATNQTIYDAFIDIVEMVIELIRQFYDLPRQFRIVGNYGAQEFINYSNQNLQPQYQGNAFGIDMGYRLPVFDIQVNAQKKNVYTKVSQNELALQFYQLGFFNPQTTDQTLMCLSMMDFDGKDEITQMVSRNGTMYDKLQQYMQLALAFAQVVRPDMVPGLAQDIQQFTGQPVNISSGLPNTKLQESGALGEAETKEHPIVEKAREQSQNASQIDQGRVI